MDISELQVRAEPDATHGHVLVLPDKSTTVFVAISPLRDGPGLVILEPTTGTMVRMTVSMFRALTGLSYMDVLRAVTDARKQASS